MSNEHGQYREGGPDWIMSYADMITILMAFFVVMYALASGKGPQERAVLHALHEQFAPLGERWESMLPAVLKRPEIQTPRRKAGQSVVAPELRSAWPGEPKRIGGVIEFNDPSDVFNPEQTAALQAILIQVAGKPQQIEVRAIVPVEATTDARWDLACARSRATMRWLVEHGIDPVRIRVAVAGADAPHDATRVEVLLLNEITHRSTDETPAAVDRSPKSNP